jgi:hypothetical protein
VFSRSAPSYRVRWPDRSGFDTAPAIRRIKKSTSHFSCNIVNTANLQPAAKFKGASLACLARSRRLTEGRYQRCGTHHKTSIATSGQCTHDRSINFPSSEWIVADSEFTASWIDPHKSASVYKSNPPGRKTGFSEKLLRPPLLPEKAAIRQLALRSFVDEHIGDDPPFDVENASIKFPQLNSSISLRRAPRPGSKHVAILWAEAGESNSG